MRVGLTFETKKAFPFRDGEPLDLDSELLSEMEEDELVSGLADAGHEVLRIGGVDPLIKYLTYWKDHCDVVFNRSVGYRGPERKDHAASVMDAAGIPYVGSTSYALTLTRRKDHAKLVAAKAGVPTPPALLWPGATRRDLEELPHPALVKPVAESSSIGIDAGSLVADPQSAERRASQVIARYGQPALVETFVRGVDVEVPIVVDPEPRALGCVALSIDGEVVSGDAFLSSDLVYSDRYGFASVPDHVDLERIERAAVAAAAALGIRDYGRIDFRVAEDGTPWFIEASTHPHLQRHSSFFALAGRRGLSYSEMLQEILDVGLRRLGIATDHQNSMSQSTHGNR